MSAGSFRYCTKMAVWREGVLLPLAVTALSLLVIAEAYKVLVVFPLDGKSHSILGEGYVRELLKKGHEVTYLTPFPMKEQPKLTQVRLGKAADKLPILATFLNISTLLTDDLPGLMDPIMSTLFTHEITKLPLEDEHFQKFIKDPKQQFDVVVAEWFYNEMYSGLGVLYQCPMVWSSSLDIHNQLQRLIDEAPNPAYYADSFSPNVPPFSFAQRAQELLILLKRVFITEFWMLSVEAAKYAEVFGPAASERGITLPAYRDVIYNSSLVLLNAHPSLGAAPKLPQNAKSIGGYHINLDTNPLPEKLQKIMDESEHGVVYFSMGSMMQSKDMPEEMKKGLLKVFGSLKQTVLWKFEEQLPNLPKNVHIQSWMPQQSILAHPNMKIFITHGGLLSTTETIHYGVPIIGVPLFGDQFLNMERSVTKGFALQVKFSMNLENDLKTAIKEVLKNTSYTKTAKHLSSIYHDRAMPPGDELVYWIEHVVRTGGAPHLRSAALLAPWYQKLFLDLLGLVLGGLLVLWLLVKKILGAWKSKKVEMKKKRS